MPHGRKTQIMLARSFTSPSRIVDRKPGQRQSAYAAMNEVRTILNGHYRKVNEIPHKRNSSVAIDK